MDKMKYNITFAVIVRLRSDSCEYHRGRRLKFHRCTAHNEVREMELNCAN